MCTAAVLANGGDEAVVADGALKAKMGDVVPDVRRELLVVGEVRRVRREREIREAVVGPRAARRGGGAGIPKRQKLQMGNGGAVIV